MTTFVLIPGAGGSAWYWSRVVPLLHAAGHRAVAVDLPGDDPTSGLADYTRLVIEAMDDATDVALVAQSLGGFTAAMVCAAAPPQSLTLVNAMVPAPGETPGEWWANTGAVEAREAAAGATDGPFDPVTCFLHDVPPAVVEESLHHQRAESDAVFASTCSFEGWPDRLSVVAGSDDRFFPVDFQRRIARERLGREIDVLRGGHLLALANPDAVAGYLLANDDDDDDAASDDAR